MVSATTKHFPFLSKGLILDHMDIVSVAVRSRMMAAVKSKNTSLEKLVFSELRRRGVAFQKHYHRLPGTPDIAFPNRKTAVFIDGDFWHGYRYPTWRQKIKSRFWRRKIEANRARDRRNFRKIRSLGWRVIRVWGHELRKDPEKVFSRIYRFTGRSYNDKGDIQYSSR